MVAAMAIEGQHTQEAKVSMDNLEIQKWIPHRYPFLLIDKISEIVANSHVTAIKNVTCNEEFFQGHFPQQPVMPGVLIIEAMADPGQADEGSPGRVAVGAGVESEVP